MARLEARPKSLVPSADGSCETSSRRADESMPLRIGEEAERRNRPQPPSARRVVGPSARHRSGWPAAPFSTARLRRAAPVAGGMGPSSSLTRPWLVDRCGVPCGHALVNSSPAASTTRFPLLPDAQRHRVVAAPQIRAHGAATDDARLFGRASRPLFLHGLFSSFGPRSGVPEGSV